MIGIKAKVLAQYILGLILAALSVCLCIAFITYSRYDATLLYNTSDMHTPANYMGAIGANSIALLLFLFGFSALLIIPLVVCITLRLWGYSMTKARITALGAGMVFSSTALYTIRYEIFSGVTPGGVVGYALYQVLTRLIDRPLIPVLLVVSIWAMAIIFLQFAWARFIVAGFTAVFTSIWQAAWCIAARNYILHYVRHIGKIQYLFAQKEDDEQTLEELVDAVIHGDYEAASRESNAVVYVQAQEPVSGEYGSSVVTSDAVFAEEVAIKQAPFALPPRSLFSSTKQQNVDREYQKECRTRAAILENKLERFGLMGSIVSITIGPVVTLYEYQPDIDVKVSKIVALEDDLALALEAHSLRIIAPMPGKSVIGFEVAYGRRMTVYFSDLITSKLYKTYDGALPLVLGQDTVGDPVIIDLTALPHVLVAGATGAGKSVALHTMLMSLLCNKTPEELKLVIIDPKRLEFVAYADCAHLLFPVIVDAAKAVAACNYVLNLMEERYSRMAAAGVRTIADYNKAHPDDPMPFIVILIDELADLMMTSGKDIEFVIARLAQMARAAGIHLIIATQRPSVDVITGLIKANFPARIAFKVASRIDSRTIIDMHGAEKLLGKGDMLFLNGQGIIKRVHGAYLTESEIQRVVDHIKQQRPPLYVELLPTAGSRSLDPEDEALYNDIISFLSTVDDVSISLLQRQFRIGYNRSARIIQQLEAEGRVMAVDGGKMRRVVK